MVLDLKKGSGAAPPTTNGAIPFCEGQFLLTENANTVTHAGQ